MAARSKNLEAVATLGDVKSAFKDPPLQFRPLQIIHHFSYFQEKGMPPEELVELLVQRGLGGAVTNVGWFDDYLESEKEWEVFFRGVKLLAERDFPIWIYDDESEMLLSQAMRDIGLSARAHDRILKVSRTIADLEGKEKIESTHLMEAIQYRSLDRAYWG